MVPSSILSSWELQRWILMEHRATLRVLQLTLKMGLRVPVGSDSRNTQNYKELHASLSLAEKHKAAGAATSSKRFK